MTLVRSPRTKIQNSAKHPSGRTVVSVLLLVLGFLSLRVRILYLGTPQESASITRAARACGKFRAKGNDDGCGPHGTCLVDRCICAPTHRGPTCTIVQPLPPKCSLTTADKIAIYDYCWNLPGGYGRLQVSHRPERTQLAQRCEKDFWETTAVPKRNEAQVVAFDNFSSLPQNLGHVLELGAGPYTKTRLILENRDDITLASATLVDPLAKEYRINPKIPCSFQNGTLCLERQTKEFCVHPTTLVSLSAEDWLAVEQFDTVLLFNTMEHCQNAIRILHNLYLSLKPGGTLVFAEEYTNPRMLQQPGDPCHPIRITRKFYEEFLRDYFSEFLFGPLSGGEIPALDGYMSPVKQTIYAIATKPG